MNAKRLPSGNYRARVFSHTDTYGKKVYVSFTAPTKREAEAQAVQYRARRRRVENYNLTVGEAARRYIEVNDGTLSESTIAGYTRYLRNLGEIDHLMIKKLSQADLQAHVSRLSKRLSPKTVKNIMGFMSAAVRMFYPDAEIRYRLPQVVRKRTRIPNDDEIVTLMQHAPRKMKLAIALGCCSLRRGEICAIQLKDVRKLDDNTYELHVHRDCVQDKDHNWVFRDKPKTPESDRFVHIPKSVYDLIEAKRPDDRIVDLMPSGLTSGFQRLQKACDTDMTFHTTRHYYASMMAYLGVPDFATAEMGGWKHVDKTMKEIYQGVSSDRKRQYLAAGVQHIERMIAKKV